MRKKIGFSIKISALCLLVGWFLPGAALQAQKVDMDIFSDMKARSVGPAGMSGRVTTIDVVENQPEIIYVGTASGGLWKSESGGINWEPIFDDQNVASIGALAIHQANPSIVWAGTGEGNPRNSQSSGAGIFKSIDGGKSWTCMGLENTRNIHRVIIDPTNPEVVYAGVQGSAWGEHPERGVFKTTDGGETWEKILYVNESTGVGDMVIDPANPQKLIVAMWQFRRWPWFFKSGGEGSGMYVTHDGGKNWVKRTEKDGIPGGELGRMGLAIARNNPKIVYALIESKKNALYRSNDGGFSWRKVNDKNDIGNRPFYYADIYVDPQNENRVYSLYSMISRSEDGGKSFQVIVPYSGVHPDHHAFWISPDDPSYLINGNDGGMAISRDMGENWRFVENLPLAQYYHINVDNEYPYNIYGGMQDNGSWRGPAYVWRSGGIRNAYFEELFFGDGFDVVPHPEDSRYGYAMSQGGNLGRYDLATGGTKFIKPLHPEGTTLRFNWNAAIAQDPFDVNTIYYGSQFVHKSTDRGENWTMISPDLTTNDPEKQKQLESGGLTYDVTQAENHTTIVAIAPSPLEKEVIWVGTDDGNLQLTQDGGKTWNNLADKLEGVPAGSWVPMIHASNHTAGEAFVVVNNYRRNDWTPFLFHTTDFGKSWKNLVDEDKVWGYALSVVQDPEAENLLFMGTEFGLYVSFDKGNTWNQWKHGYPTVSTIDLKIHPREHDLVIGTFGRAAFIIDDIRPLRELALEGADILDKRLHVIPAPTGVQAITRQASGTRFAADGMFAGQNRYRGAMLSFLFNPPAKRKPKGGKDGAKAGQRLGMEAMANRPQGPGGMGRGGRGARGDSVKMEILNADREIIRTLKFKADSGLNRIYWGMDQKGVAMPRLGGGRGFGGGGRARREPSGGPVMPGTYLARFSFRKAVDSTEVMVIMDPRVDYKPADLEAMMAMNEDRMGMMKQFGESMQALQKAEATLKKVKGLMPKGDTTQVFKDFQKAHKAVADSIKSINAMVRSDNSKQGIYRDPNLISSKIFMSSGYLRTSLDPPNGTQKTAMAQMKEEVEAFSSLVDGFIDGMWKDYKEKASKVDLSPFRED
ncbi:MAG: hypothetical protein AAFP92_22075 [Bacteroidota bacterium]